jgi:hypothetical protein
MRDNNIKSSTIPIPSCSTTRSPPNNHLNSQILPPPHYNMSGEVLKADKDFTKETDKLIPEAEKLAKVMTDTPWL